MEYFEFKYRDWIIQTDKKVNTEVYSKVEKSSAQECGCDDCLKFESLKEELYPNEVKYLFKKIGIDFKKEAEIWCIPNIEDGTNLYSGFFHFKGNFEGKNCRTQQTETGHSLDLVNITENFSIGFHLDNSLSFFDDKYQTVQIEFEVKI